MHTKDSMERSNPRMSSEHREQEQLQRVGFSRRASLFSPYAPFNLNPVGLGFMPQSQSLRSHSWDANSAHFNQPYSAPYTAPYHAPTWNSYQPYSVPNVDDCNYMTYPFQESHPSSPNKPPQFQLQAAHPLGQPMSHSMSQMDRPHPCHFPGCGRMFKRLEHLKRHFRSIHTLDRPYPCRHPNCNKSFSRSDNLAQHMRIHRKSSVPTPPTELPPCHPTN
ncbi:hypothetical protein DSO57_1038160 [Entomophthora muscae]|uniref:Uncharacterized protein n=1 Tax=Entomophthora muscae TaxID=34485 RepID=A0ACC2SBU0_9FUNG|nr:hypothetical protein DSO57_1038160 [Entomophthora muscae]